MWRGRLLDSDLAEVDSVRDFDGGASPYLLMIGEGDNLIHIVCQLFTETLIEEQYALIG